jgi:hypothetical protein
VSHASGDKAIVRKLVQVIEAGLEVPEGSVFCSSVDGFGLDGGDDTPEVIRANLKGCSVVIAVITPNSLASKWVLLELGAAWVLGKKAIPLIAPGASFDDLPGKFKDINALPMGDGPKMAGLVDTLARYASLSKRNNGARLRAALDEFAGELRTGPAPAISPVTAASEPAVDMDDDSILARLEVLLANTPEYILADKPVLFEVLDRNARVPKGASARLIAKALAPNWREVTRRGDVSITLHREPERVRDVMSGEIE